MVFRGSSALRHGGGHDKPSAYQATQVAFCRILSIPGSQRLTDAETLFRDRGNPLSSLKHPPNPPTNRNRGAV